MVMLSDLFHDKSQFDWMFGTLYDFTTTHTTDDELVNQFITLGLCKAAAVIVIVSI